MIRFYHTPALLNRILFLNKQTTTILLQHMTFTRPQNVVVFPQNYILTNSWVSCDVINFTGGQLQIDTLSSD